MARVIASLMCALGGALVGLFAGPILGMLLFEFLLDDPGGRAEGGFIGFSLGVFIGPLVGAVGGFLLLRRFRKKGEDHQKAHSARPSAPPQSSVPTETKRGLALASMVLGILAFTGLGPLTGIPALITGYMALGRVKAEPHLYGGRSFSLIGVILGWINIILFIIVVAVIVHGQLRSWALTTFMEVNESYAPHALHSLSLAEEPFQSAAFVDEDENGVGDYGTLEQLFRFDGTNYNLQFIKGELASGSHLGYTFTVNVTHGAATADPAYTITAVPIVSGDTGVRQFFVDQTKVIRYTDDGSDVGSDSSPLPEESP